ncbi:dicarboxylate/amino acid:cation symporter [Cytobacillus praedii]|uniref:Dicarboxylate/amino acid:cation symporter n=1 Tax=Cytobacillus praedii TaxID=1742358 RepID=A0A4R1B0M7_9BACI|nr:dicarboxylate/amino acid:cation symporter [Cytobacillus praedii]TCJ04699.1 dicarboxylate/amino acid:cation symporter [Cytobacillus praedii]
MKIRMNITTQIILATILGVLFGGFFGKFMTSIDVFGNIFLRLIQMSIVLLVMGQIIEAVGGLNPRKLGKLGFKTVIVFITSSFLAALFGMAIGVLFKIGNGIDSSLLSDNPLPEIGTASSVEDTILNFFPTNIISSMAQGSIVQVIIFAIIFGLALSYVRLDDKENKIFQGTVQFNSVILKLVTLIMKIAPVGIFFIIASTIGSMGLQVLLPLAKYLLIYCLATFIFLFLWFLFVSIYCKVSMVKLIKNMAPMSIMALTTTSSAVTLPIALKDAKEKLGISERITKLVLPLGMSLNSNGSAMHMAITLVTISQIAGISYSGGEYFYLVILATLASLANAVVPGAGLVSLSIVVPQLGLPIESIALFAGVEWFVGMLRTILNVDSDTLSAFIIAKSENEIDYKVFNQ